MATRKTTAKKRVSAKSKVTRGGTSSKRAASRRRATPRKRTDKKPTTRKKTASKKRTTRSTKKSRDLRLNLQQKSLIGGIGILITAAIMVLSILSPNQGSLTTALFELLWKGFGWGGYIMPLIIGIVGIYFFFWGMDQPLELPIFRLIGFVLLFITAESFASLIMVMNNNGLNDVWAVAKASPAQSGGGYFGGLFVYALLEAVGSLGSIFTLMVLAIGGLILAWGLTREDMSYYLHATLDWFQREDVDERPSPQRNVPINSGRSRRALKRDDEEAIQPPLIPDPAAEIAAADEPKRKRPSRRKKEPPKPEPVPVDPTVVSPVFLGNDGRPKGYQWTLPQVADMLEPGMDQDNSGAIIREQVEVIEHTLDSFGAPATVVEINQGPTITQFGVEPNFIQMRSGKRTKVKVGKIAGLADDLALALAAKSIRIQAPVPGKGYVGIEVPNPAKALVSLRDVMETAAYQKATRKSPLAIGLGQDVGGQPIVANLDSMPHMLIAGTTGSGKSVAVNGIIACLLLQNTPDTLKLVMVDPKRVELTGYNGIPHLAAPVIVEIDKVIGTLQWALREMDSRYKQFAEVGARNIVEFNKKVRRHKKLEPIPYIVIIIDELADLMMLSPDDTERSITRLAQLARATGMHMVIATQRPSVDVVTGLIKANFPARVAFAVSSGTDSRVILDTTGAERLLGQGDMLFQSPDAAAPIRAQGCFVSDEELTKLIAYWQRARRFTHISAEDSIKKRPTRQPAVKPTAAAKPPKRQPAPQQQTLPTIEAPVINMNKPQDADSVDEAETVAISPPIRKKPSPKRRPKPTPKQATQEEAVEPATPPSTTSLKDALQAVEDDKDAPQLDDDLLPEAIAMVRKLNKASTSLLQRRFRIGYTRAARMVDYMEDVGIIGPPTGTSKAREVTPWQNEEEAA